MEVLLEIILQVFGWLFQLFGELILQLVMEAIAELIGHSLKEPFRRPGPLNPWLAAVGYGLFGAAGGALSLALLPELFIAPGHLRVLNLVLTPIAAGLVMALLGAWRRRRDKDTIRLETFAYGYCFALAMASVRFAFGH